MQSVKIRMTMYARVVRLCVAENRLLARGRRIPANQISANTLVHNLMMNTYVEGMSEKMSCQSYFT